MSNHLLDKATHACVFPIPALSIIHLCVACQPRNAQIASKAAAASISRLSLQPTGAFVVSEFPKPANLVLVCTRSTETSARGSELTGQVRGVEGACPTSKICLSQSNEQRPGGMAHSGRHVSTFSASGYLARPYHEERADPFMCCDGNEVPAQGVCQPCGA